MLSNGIDNLTHISPNAFHDRAEVIKVENPDGGDDTRAWGPPFAKNLDGTETESAYFLSVNRNKKSITVNIRSEEGRQVIYELVKKADVFVENYVPGKLDKMGLGYKDLSALNPRLVYASITGKAYLFSNDHLGNSFPPSPSNKYKLL